jgi:hypothetical protein
VIHYITKPTFVWLAAQDEKTNTVYITLSLLGHKGAGAISADAIRNRLVDRPSYEMQDLLLQQDPLAAEYRGGGQLRPTQALEGAVLTKLLGGGSGNGLSHATAIGRFVPGYEFEYTYAESQSGHTFVRELTESDVNTTVTTETVTTKESGGFLAYIAKNVPHDGEKRMKTVQGTSAGTTTSDKVKVDVVYGAGANEGYTINTYFDNLYGTFAFVEAPPADQEASGQMMSAAQPVSNKDVTLVGPDGLSSAQKTNAQGKFSFRSKLLRPGQYKLVVEGKEYPFTYSGQPMRGMIIDLAGGKQQVAAAPGGQTAAERAKAAGGKTRVSGRGGGGFETTQPTASEGDTAIAIRGRPPTTGPSESSASGAYTMAVNPILKGRLGRVVVKFPENNPCKNTHVEIRRDGSKDVSASFYGNGEIELLPGTYSVNIFDKRIDGVKVQSKNDTTLATGVLHVNLDKNTHVEVLDSDQKTQITSGYGTQEFGLPVGTYYVKVAGQSEPVQIKQDQVTEF